MLQKGRYTELMSYIHRLVSENHRDPQWRLRRLEAVESILFMGLWEAGEKLIERMKNEKGSHRLAFVQDDNTRVASAVGGGGRRRRAS
jgi:FlaA1/EpsC-like NDP-sugar epimerase